MEWAFVVYVLSGDADHRTMKLVDTYDQCIELVEAETRRVVTSSLPPVHADCVYVSEVYDETILDDVETNNVSVTIVD